MLILIIQSLVSIIDSLILIIDFLIWIMDILISIINSLISNTDSDVALRFLCCFELARITLHVRRFLEVDRVPARWRHTCLEAKNKKWFSMKTWLEYISWWPRRDCYKGHRTRRNSLEPSRILQKKKRFEGTRWAIAINSGRHLGFWKAPSILFTKVNPIRQLNWERPPRLILQPYLDNYSIFLLIKGASEPENSRRLGTICNWIRTESLQV